MQKGSGYFWRGWWAKMSGKWNPLQQEGAVGRKLWSSYLRNLIWFERLLDHMILKGDICHWVGSWGWNQSIGSEWSRGRALIPWKTKEEESSIEDGAADHLPGGNWALAQVPRCAGWRGQDWPASWGPLMLPQTPTCAGGEQARQSRPEDQLRMTLAPLCSFFFSYFSTVLLFNIWYMQRNVWHICVLWNTRSENPHLPTQFSSLVSLPVKRVHSSLTENIRCLSH